MRMTVYYPLDYWTTAVVIAVYTAVDLYGTDGLITSLDNILEYYNRSLEPWSGTACGLTSTASAYITRNLYISYIGYNYYITL